MHVKPEKMKVRAESEKRYWWLHARSAPDMRRALAGHGRYIATAIVAKHRLFVWLYGAVLPSHAVCVIARSDDTTFGILHSRFHELWSLRLGTSLEDRPRYTPTTTFETFPFPAGLTPALSRVEGPRDTAPVFPADAGIQSNQAAGEARHWTPASAGVTAESIAAAAKQLNALREAWLNPPEWVDWVRTPEEEQAGFPLRPVAKPRPFPLSPNGGNPLPLRGTEVPPALKDSDLLRAKARAESYAGEGAKAESTPTYEAELKKRTLTNLYNARPAWLDHAHRELDAAVAAAYGWTDYTPEMPDEEILKRLLALNLQRATQ
jgi:hypothetical protein